MKRILVIGSCGAGKSYLSKALSQKLNLPLIHLDHLFWEPNWKQRSREDFDRRLQTELNKSEWIMDGNYNRTLPTRLRYADTVIHLNYNRWVCLYRVIKRWMAQELHAKGCPSKIDLPFLWYVFHGYPTKHRLRSALFKQEFPFAPEDAPMQILGHSSFSLIRRLF